MTVTPHFSTDYVHLALRHLDTGDRTLRSRIAETAGARHIVAHVGREVLIATVVGGPEAVFSRWEDL